MDRDESIIGGLMDTIEWRDDEDQLKYTIMYIERYMVGIVTKEQMARIIRGCIRYDIGREYIDRVLDMWKFCKK